MKITYEVIIEKTDLKTYDSYQIVSVPTLYAVVYENDPVTIRIKNHSYDIADRYRKTLHTTKGFADNQARKLNQKFKTDKFAVVELLIKA
jgi:hypothetical protein